MLWSHVTRRRVRLSLAAIGAAWLVWATGRSARRVPVWRDNAVFNAHLMLDAPTTYFAAFAAGSIGKGPADRIAPRPPIDTRSISGRMTTAYSSASASPLRQQNRCDEAEPILERGLAVDTTTDIVRSQLIECQLTLHEWDAATQTAEDGLLRGHEQFRGELIRIRRAEAAADSAPVTARRGAAGGG